MKTSTILLVCAVVIIVTSLTAYNFTLRASFLSGDYKNPYYGLSFNPVKQISSVRLSSSNNFQLQVVQGKKEGLYFSDRVKGRFVFSTVGNRILIDLTEESKKSGFTVYGDDMILVLSRMDSLILKPYFKVGDEQQRHLSGSINVKGFAQPSMTLDLGTGSAVSMDSLKIENLRALIGNNGDGPSELALYQGVYGAAIFDIPGKGTLQLLNPEITKSEYRLSKTASVTLNGRALKHMQ